jgi:hypothetical protein
LIAFAGSLALDTETPVDADWSVLGDVELDEEEEDEEEEFAANNFKMSAADKPL